MYVFYLCADPTEVQTAKAHSYSMSALQQQLGPFPQKPLSPGVDKDHNSVQASVHKNPMGWAPMDLCIFIVSRENAARFCFIGVFLVDWLGFFPLLSSMLCKYKPDT